MNLRLLILLTFLCMTFGAYGKVVETNDILFKSQVAPLIERGGVVVIEFYATWCSPCRILEPQIEWLSEKHKKVNFFKVDIDRNPVLESSAKITSIPTVIVISNNKGVFRMVGLPNDNLSVLESVIKTAESSKNQ